MVKNTGLAKAKDAKKDEFYTTYEDIQAEINHYEEKFKGKTVLCNCDDPFESNFCKFFLRNFNYLGLKRLICTSYSTSPVIGIQMPLFDFLDEPVVRGNGYVIDVDKVPMANGRGVSDEDIDSLLKSKKRGVKKLKGDGDFRSAECIEYLKQADIIVTNPPFSLFREYVALLMTYQKSFLIIGNVNAITYKEIFPLIKDNQLWLGASIHSGDRKFYVPDNYPLHASGCGIDDDGRKFIRVKGVRWFTNIDYAIRHEELVLFKRYYGNEEEYPKYDNYDAINVDKTSNIPCDYYEIQKTPSNTLNGDNPKRTENFGVNEFAATDRQTDSCLSYHQTQNVTESWESLSHSSISIAQTNLRLSEQLKAKEKASPPDCGTQTAESLNHLSQAKESTSAYSSNARCSGIMGVPITFLDKYNPEQFEIVGCANYTGKYGSDEIGIEKIGEEWIKKYRAQGGRGHYTANMTSLVYYDGNGNAKNTFTRILIKRRTK